MDRDGGDVLPVEGENGVAHGVDVGAAAAGGVPVGGLLVCLLLMGDVALHGVVLQVVCGGDLGQESGDHLDDIVDGHGAHVVLHLLEWGVVEDAAGLGARGEELRLGEGLYMRQVADVDDGLRGRRRGSQCRRRSIGSMVGGMVP